MIRRIEEMEKQIEQNAAEILRSARHIEANLDTYSERKKTIPHIKDLIFTLRETAHLVNECEMDMCSQRIDMMPCTMCNNHYPVASEHIKGIRWEPVPGKGWVYICWECAIGLGEVINRQMKSLSYNFLFSLDKETGTQRGKLLKEIEEVR
ncbi:MAG TPA: hypothetical protein VGL94_08390 [Ktedonobacteraceae bacterium]|jgi:hypothetical protein